MSNYIILATQAENPRVQRVFDGGHTRELAERVAQQLEDEYAAEWFFSVRSLLMYSDAEITLPTAVQ